MISFSTCLLVTLQLHTSQMGNDAKLKLLVLFITIVFVIFITIESGVWMWNAPVFMLQVCVVSFPFRRSHFTITCSIYTWHI